MFNKYSESIRVVYVSKSWSAASFTNALFLLTCVIAPYIIIYKTQGLWVRLERFKEQPKVAFKHDALLILETIDAGNKIHPLLWSTFPGLKGMMNYELSPLIKTREGDLNFDSINEFLDIEYFIPLSKNVSVTGVHLILLFEYQFNEYAKLNMESMIYVCHQSGRTGNHYEFTGDMSLVQKEPLWKRQTDSRYNYDVIPRKSSSSEDYTLPKIFAGYAHRNVSTILANKYDIWQSDPESTNSFVLKGRIYYKSEIYECWAGFWEMLKWAWVQYIAFFALVYPVVRLLQQTLYKAKIFETILTVPLLRQAKQSISSNNI